MLPIYLLPSQAREILSWPNLTVRGIFVTKYFLSESSFQVVPQSSSPVEVMTGSSLT